MHAIITMREILSQLNNYSIITLLVNFHYLWTHRIRGQLQVIIPGLPSTTLLSLHHTITIITKNTPTAPGHKLSF